MNRSVGVWASLLCAAVLWSFAAPASAQRYDASQLDAAYRTVVEEARGAQVRALAAAGRAQGGGQGTLNFTGTGGDSYLGDGYSEPDGGPQRNGYGLMTWADGEYYAGQHRGGTVNGGHKEGFGVYYFADGRMFEGQFAGDRQHGLGVLWDQQGAVLRVGRWVNGSVQ